MMRDNPLIIRDIKIFLDLTFGFSAISYFVWTKTSSTHDIGTTYYIIDDFGIGVLLASICLGIIFWAKRAELPLAAQILNSGEYA